MAPKMDHVQSLLEVFGPSCIQRVKLQALQSLYSGLRLLHAKIAAGQDDF